MNAGPHDRATVATLTAHASAEIDDVLANLRQAALASGGLCCVRLVLPNGATQLIAATFAAGAPPDWPDRPDLAGGLFGAHASVASVAGSSDATGDQGMTVEHIRDAVEDALNNLHWPRLLAGNPLAHKLQLQRFRRPHDNPQLADGFALQRAIDAAVQAIAHTTDPRQARLATYFRMRYRDRATQQDVAGSFGRSERTATRMKNRLVENVARELLRQQRVDDRNDPRRSDV